MLLLYAITQSQPEPIDHTQQVFSPTKNTSTTSSLFDKAAGDVRGRGASSQVFSPCKKTRVSARPKPSSTSKKDQALLGGLASARHVDRSLPAQAQTGVRHAGPSDGTFPQQNAPGRNGKGKGWESGAPCMPRESLPVLYCRNSPWWQWQWQRRAPPRTNPFFPFLFLMITLCT